MFGFLGKIFYSDWYGYYSTFGRIFVIIIVLFNRTQKISLLQYGFSVIVRKAYMVEFIFRYVSQDIQCHRSPVYGGQNWWSVYWYRIICICHRGDISHRQCEAYREQTSHCLILPALMRPDDTGNQPPPSDNWSGKFYHEVYLT